MCKISIRLFLCLSLVFSIACYANNPSNEDEKELNVGELIFEHTGDSYEWHIINIGEKSISIPLPVIVYSKYSGLHIFLSSQLHHHTSYQGLSFGSHEGSYSGKIVEKTTSGEEYRPFDISITKNVVQLFITVAILLLCILLIARWYKKHEGYETPRGFLGVIDMMIMDINNNIIKSCIGPNYRKFAPYLLTVFFFILLSNLLGQFPVFPGGANLTGNIAITFVLAMFTFLLVNIFGTREYWKEIFWPDVPIWLKIPTPIIPLIEFVGVFTKPFTLMIRLFANILAGHAIIIGLCCLIFITAKLGAAANTGMTVVSIFFMIFMGMMELLIAYIQAYVFTLLSAVFIGLAQVRHHHH